MNENESKMIQLEIRKADFVNYSKISLSTVDNWIKNEKIAYKKDEKSGAVYILLDFDRTHNRATFSTVQDKKDDNEINTKEIAKNVSNELMDKIINELSVNVSESMKNEFDNLINQTNKSKEDIIENLKNLVQSDDNKREFQQLATLIDQSEKTKEELNNTKIEMARLEERNTFLQAQLDEKNKSIFKKLFG